MRRRVSEGYRPFKPTDKQVRKAARRAAGVGWWTAKANGIANAFVFVGNLGAEASRTTGEVQRGLAAEAGPNAPVMTRTNRAMAATFGAAARKAVTGVGAPS